MKKAMWGVLVVAVLSVLVAAAPAAAQDGSGAKGDVNCSDFSSQAAAQAAYENSGPGDPNGLDADGDGIACETNPCPCSTGDGGDGGDGGGGANEPAPEPEPKPECEGRATTYRGGVKRDPTSSTALVIGCDKGERIVRSFTARDFVIGCESQTEARLSNASIRGRSKINDKGKFTFKGRSGGVEFRVAGSLSGKRLANGSFRYSGPTDVEGTTLRCDSGNLDWGAQR